VRLGTERPDHPQAGIRIGEDPHNACPALDLLVKPLEHVGRLEIFLVGTRQAVEGRVRARPSPSDTAIAFFLLIYFFRYLSD